ncbi:MAG: hypothetical protein LBR31_09090 [Desulfovibrio sp.]|jgi:predicted esterase YcpF (UPF0227 family)|nr:hypothetical protein [Desulfovibrio sp.]
MIINIHGFTGNGDNTKSRWLKANIVQHEIFSPTIDYAASNPESILELLSNKISSCPGTDSPRVLGSSLGAFYARCLNLLFPETTTVLINPALVPFLTLRGRIDCKAYLALFARLAYRDDAMSNEKSRLHVIIGDSDELIDHEHMTKPLLPPNFQRIHVIRGGRHRLELTPEVGGILKSILS